MEQKDSNFVDKDKIQIMGKRAVRGTFVLTIRKFFLQAVSYLGSIFLARILAPEIFGIFAIVSFVITFFSFFADAGLGAALIQKKEKLKPNDLKLAFTLQQGLVSILVLLIFLIAPSIVNHYNLSKEAVWLIRVFSLSLFLTSLKTVPLILLERKLRFNKVVIPEIIEVISFQIIAVGLAFLNFSVWSFIIALLVRTTLGVIVLYLISPFKIGFYWDSKKAKSLLSFGIPYQANGFIAMVKDAVMPIFVGSVAGAAALGYLNWAYTFSKIPILLMSDIFRVSFPGFSRIQDNKDLLTKALNKTLKYTNMFLFPSVFLLMATAEKIIHYVFTDKWLPGLPAFYIHSVGILVVGIANTFMNALWACRKVKIATKLMIIYTIVNWATSVPLVYLMGFNGAMVGSVIVLLISLPLNTYYIKKIANVSILENTWPPLLAGLLAGLIVFGLSPYLIKNLVSLILVLLLGGLLYLLFLFVFEGKKLLKELNWLLNKIK
ncbi:lipopolysaccharide biosynthesis protein [Patescibacteria group bacterium]